MKNLILILAAMVTLSGCMGANGLIGVAFSSLKLTSMGVQMATEEPSR